MPMYKCGSVSTTTKDISVDMGCHGESYTSSKWTGTYTFSSPVVIKAMTVDWDSWTDGGPYQSAKVQIKADGKVIASKDASSVASDNLYWTGRASAKKITVTAWKTDGLQYVTCVGVYITYNEIDLDLYKMTSNNTPSPFSVTGSADPACWNVSGQTWYPFSRGQGVYSCNCTGAGEGVSAEIDLGRNFKNLKIQAKTGGDSTCCSYLYAYYADTSSWVRLAYGYYENLDGFYWTATDRPVRKIKIEDLYGSGEVYGYASLEKCLVIDWEKIVS